MKTYLLLIILIILFILIDRFIKNKESFYMKDMSDENKELMMKRVQNYPSTYSIDPLYESKFKPECCPGPYTSSSGCLCFNKDNYSLINSRGGNSYSFEYATHPTPEPSRYTYS